MQPSTPTSQVSSPAPIVQCTQDSDCSSGKYCCYVNWSGPPVKECKSSCVGDNCYENSDCGKNEYCTYNQKCALQPSTPTSQVNSPTPIVKCTQDSDCSSGTYCCFVSFSKSGVRQCKSSCVGDLCKKKGDCGADGICGPEMICERRYH